MVTDDVFAVIAEATRRDILVSLQAGDKAVGELVEELAASQPTISKHLKVLREADLVSMRAQGQKRYYALNPKPLQGVAEWLGTFDVGPLAASAATAVGGSTSGTQTVPEAAPSSDSHVSIPADSAEAVLAATAVEPSPVSAAPGAGLAAARAAAADDSVSQQIGRTVGRAATRAADLLASLPKVPKVPNLPKFGRKK